MSLIATKLAVFAASQNRVSDQFNRFTDTQALAAAVRMSNSPDSILITAGERINQSFERAWAAGSGFSPNTVNNTISIPIYKDPTLTVTSTRSCTFTCTSADSQFVTLTPITYVVDICIDHNELRNNAISEETDLSRKWAKAKHSLYNAMQSDFITFLDTNKSTVIAGATDLGYTIVGDALRISSAQRARSFADLEVLAEYNNFRLKPYQMIAHQFLRRDVDFFYNQGAGNATNYSYQFGNMDYWFTNQITNAANMYATAYFMEPSTVGLAFRVPPAYREGKVSDDGKHFLLERLDEIGVDAALLYTSECSNGVDTIDKYKISIDMAIVSQYTDAADTRATGIWKIEYTVA